VKYKAIVSESSYDETIKYLNSIGVETKIIKFEGYVYSEINDHPDVFLLNIEGDIFIPPNIIELEKLLLDNKVSFSNTRLPLGKSYPIDSILNVAIVGKNAICNTIYTDKNIIEYFNKNNYFIHHVKQGYSSCSIVPVSANAFITGDRGIYNSLKDCFDILYLDSMKIILKDSKMNGLLGGTCALIDKYLIFNGTPIEQKYKELIINFVNKYNKTAVFSCDKPLKDMGSVRVFLEVK
jgi:hypothetical protein